MLRAIQRRLEDSNTSTIYLTLIVMETCIKNCGSNFARHVDKVLMNDIVSISKTQYLGPNKPSDEARLLREKSLFTPWKLICVYFYQFTKRLYGSFNSGAKLLPVRDRPCLYSTMYTTTSRAEVRRNFANTLCDA